MTSVECPPTQPATYALSMDIPACQKLKGRMNVLNDNHNQCPRQGETVRPGGARRSPLAAAVMPNRIARSGCELELRQYGRSAIRYVDRK